MAVNKVRLDQYLVQNGMVQSRERAKALIMSGIVFVNEQKADKAGDTAHPAAGGTALKQRARRAIALNKKETP